MKYVEQYTCSTQPTEVTMTNLSIIPAQLEGDLEASPDTLVRFTRREFGKPVYDALAGKVRLVVEAHLEIRRTEYQRLGPQPTVCSIRIPLEDVVEIVTRDDVRRDEPLAVAWVRKTRFGEEDGFEGHLERFSRS